MPKLALLTAIGGPIELAIGPSFLQHTRFPFDRLIFASADAGLVPRGALVP